MKIYKLKKWRAKTMMDRVTYNYYTLQDIITACHFDISSVKLNKLCDCTSNVNVSFDDLEKTEYFFRRYLLPRTLYEIYIISKYPLEFNLNFIQNEDVNEFFNKLVSKINGFFSTYGNLINEYQKSINELITNGVATSINKSHTNDTPESVQTDKYDEKYASQVIKQETTIQDQSGVLIDKLNNYQNKIEDIYEMLYNEIDKMIVGDVYEL